MHLDAQPWSRAWGGEDLGAGEGLGGGGKGENGISLTPATIKNILKKKIVLLCKQ